MSFFYSLYFRFYEEESCFNFLATTFKKNAILFKEFPGFSVATMPPFYQIEKFLVSQSKSTDLNTKLTVRQYFKIGKAHIIWLFSVYEILKQKSSFLNFVQFYFFQKITLSNFFYAVCCGLEVYRYFHSQR